MGEQTNGAEIMRCYGWRPESRDGAAWVSAWLVHRLYHAVPAWGSPECVSCWRAWRRDGCPDDPSRAIPRLMAALYPQRTPGVDGDGSAA